MSRNTLIQIILIIAIFLSSVIVYLVFFKPKSYIDASIEIEKGSELSSIDKKNDLINKNFNVIENLEYRSFDSLGNEYIIKAKKAESTLDNIDILNLTEVNGLILLTNKPSIKIFSKYATHNKKNFNTKFYNQVEVIHENTKILSENLDLLYNKNLVNLYNINEINYENSIIKADRVVFDMLTKDISINMYNQQTKVDLLYKNNGNN